MKSTCLLLVLLNEILLGNGGSEHVHFKIHVPEIIKHHIHTKTIFIHKTIPRKKYVPKKKEVPKNKPNHSHEDRHKDHHHEWKYWTSYFHQDDHRDADHDSKQEGPNGGYKDYEESHKSEHMADHDHPDSYFPQRESYTGNLSPVIHEDYANGAIGYSYPPQYSSHPEVHELSNNHLESPKHSYEEGYRKGIESESGAIYTKELNKFNYDTHEEEEDDEEEEEADHLENDKEETDRSESNTENEEIKTTHAGRYFVNEDVDESPSSYGSEIKERVSRKVFKG